MIKKEDIKNLPIEFYADKIANDEQFSLMRWGDGEMGLVLGEPIGMTDANGHAYFDDLACDLRKVLCERILMPRRYDYMLAIQDLGLETFGEKWDAHIDTYAGPSLEWVWSTPFMTAMQQIDPPGLLSFVNALANRYVIMVGPGFLIGSLPFEPAVFIQVPERNCYLELAEIVGQVTHKATKFQAPVILLSCGMAAKVLLHTIYPYFKLWGGTIIDCGSLWDPFAGRHSRSCWANLPTNILGIYAEAMQDGGRRD